MLNIFKSFIKNKANKIYFIVLFVLFIIICFYLNLDDIAYNYYNSKIEAEGITEKSKTILIQEVINLSEKEVKDIKQIDHVINVTNKEMESSLLGTIKFYEISVDDWKNVNSVIKELDNKGIRCSRAVIGDYYDTLFNNYENIQFVLKISGILIVIVFSLLFINCWKNIFKNEEKNISILKTIGYRNSKINIIKFNIFIVVSFITFVLSFITTKICFIILL